MAVQARIDWSKDSRYPTKTVNCGICSDFGIKRLSWDLQRYICTDSKACLERWKKQGFRGTSTLRKQPQQQQQEGPMRIGEMRALGSAFPRQTFDPPTDEVVSFDEDDIAIVRAVTHPSNPVKETSVPKTEPKTIQKDENGNHLLTCSKCGIVWTKPAQRGRPAKLCITCRSAA